MKKSSFFSTRNLAIMGLMAALATVLMFFSFPLPFVAPQFYKLDLSEIPVLMGSFMLGPVAGVVIELVKILLNLMLTGSGTGGVGELANFCIGCALVIPAGIIYRVNKTKKGAIIGMIVGTLVMTVVGVFMNAWVMLPFYSAAGMPMEQIIAAGAAINPAICTVWTFCWIAVAPFNLIKGVIASLVTALLYKRVSVLLKGSAGAARKTAN